MHPARIRTHHSLARHQTNDAKAQSEGAQLQEETKRMSWTSSDRRKRLPNNWPQLVTQTRQRANGKCQALKHHPRCDGNGTECDHITPSDNHNMSNLQWLNTWCHQQKTQQEARTNNQRRATMRKRPTEPHPGQTQLGRDSGRDPATPPDSTSD